MSEPGRSDEGASSPPAAVVALVGGTGKLGSALALRLAHAGRRVVIGSRDRSRAEQVAAALTDRVASTPGPGPNAPISGSTNEGAVEASDLVVVTVPFEAQAATVGRLAALIDGRIVVSTAIPVVYEDGSPRHAEVAEGSASEQLAAILPRARVVGALHTVSSAVLARLERDLDQDIIVCGDDAEAKLAAAELLAALPGIRVVDGGRLRNARYTEQLTVLLLTVNMRARRSTGVRVTNLPDELTMRATQPLTASSQT